MTTCFVKVIDEIAVSVLKCIDICIRNKTIDISGSGKNAREPLAILGIVVVLQCFANVL